jgi:hypothetical protein
MGDKKMSDLEFIEFGEFISPLERAARQYRTQPANEAVANLLKEAIALSATLERGDSGASLDPNLLEQARETARRGEAITPEQIQLLYAAADEAGEESYQDQYVLMELVQAAASGCAAIETRNESSGRLAIAAKGFQQWERVRQAYADVVEGLETTSRFFRVDRQKYAEVEDRYRRRWDEVRERTGGTRALFDPAGESPDLEWARLVEWNSDLGPNQGLLAQVDATIRLAIRLEHWRDNKGEPVGPVVERMVAHWEGAQADEETAFDAQRFMATAGDAAVEIGDWELGALVFARLLKCTSYPEHPIAFHATVQKALCHLMAGDPRACRAQLSTVPRAKMESLSEMIVTVASEFARYLAVEHACRKRLGEPVPENIRERLRGPLGTVAAIARRNPETRTEYLRSLYCAVLFRDVDAALAGAAS